ncbi:MAG TPA: hypothetical protein VFG67_00680 [Oleiagrimonas sp.]|nr:hypothetical protein [Oleiagrimonas sp.]
MRGTTGLHLLMIEVHDLASARFWGQVLVSVIDFRRAAPKPGVAVSRIRTKENVAYAANTD